ncbi:hypothetical protein BRO05_07740, partial [Xanthomonas oryzae pv. oryzae]
MATSCRPFRIRLVGAITQRVAIWAATPTRPNWRSSGAASAIPACLHCWSAPCSVAKRRQHS